MTEACAKLPFVLGLPQIEAQSRLVLQGFSVECELLEPRKPPQGDSLRVIQVLQTGEQTVKLIVANFRTKVAEGADAEA